MRSKRDIVTGFLAACLIVASAVACTANAATRRGRYEHPPSSHAYGYTAFVLTVPNHLSRWQARRRLQAGLADLQRQYGFLFSIQEQRWIGYHLRFRATVLGQAASGSIVIETRYARLTLWLPGLVEGLVEMARPAIAKAGTALLERKRPRRRTAP